MILNTLILIGKFIYRYFKYYRHDEYVPVKNEWRRLNHE